MTSYAQGIADERERCARVALGPGDLGDEEAYYGRVIAEAIRNTGHAWDSRHGIPTLEAAATPQPPLVVPEPAREREALRELVAVNDMAEALIKMTPGEFQGSPMRHEYSRRKPLAWAAARAALAGDQKDQA